MGELGGGERGGARAPGACPPPAARRRRSVGLERHPLEAERIAPLPTRGCEGRGRIEVTAHYGKIIAFPSQFH